MKQSRSLVVLSMLVLLATFGCAPGNDEMNEEMEPVENDAYEEVEEVEEPMETTDMGTTEATATLTTADGTEVGTVTFTADDMGGVAVSADFHDVEGDGMHGFHIHEGTECSAPTFESAGSHFNPESTDHACPPTTPRHAGDFGNVEISGGSGTLDTDSDLISLVAGISDNVVGKAVILHTGEDDCTSQPSGAAGDRLACGIITGADDSMMDEGTMGDDAMDEGMADEGDEGAEY